MQTHHDPNIAIELSAVIVTVVAGEPQVMVVPDWALPSGPFRTQHRTLEQGLRAWVEAQSGLSLDYVEQLYTFADKDRTVKGRRLVSIGYLALTRATENPGSAGSRALSPWYRHFPWEDYRQGTPQPLMTLIAQGLKVWINAARDPVLRRARAERCAVHFPKDPRHWNEELVLQRYELLWEAGLIPESRSGKLPKEQMVPGQPMAHDHRRILATGMARLRCKIKYRPVVFELMPDRFTLLQLQSVEEGLAGLRLHKQNFRRLVQGQGLVEETGGEARDRRGRPAKLFSFRREVLRERAVAGTKLPRSG
ncbi:MAG: hypothetical protein HGA90_02910 [Alphaproteobacteria bacterium]|nr:hypothetical protein [Alphaproteobacteria bacterium]